MIEYQMNERHACRLMQSTRSTHRYRGRREDRDGALRARLKELATRRMRFRYGRLTAMLAREGTPANHRPLYRLCRQEGLTMPIRHRRPIHWKGAGPRPLATTPNHRPFIRSV